MENIPGQGDRVNLEQSESTGVADQLHPPSFVTVHLPRLPGDEILYQQEPDAVRADTEATSDFDILAVTQEARRHFALATYTRILKGDVNLIDRRVANANVIGMETLIMVQKAMHHRLRLYAV